MGWEAAYVGKPWVANPTPPLSYNCGELVRAVHKDVLGFVGERITADASSLAESVKAFKAERFGLRPLREDEGPRDFDVVFLARARYADHCGVAVETLDGLMILHCLQGGGVVLESPREALGRGFARLEWYRRVDLV